MNAVGVLNEVYRTLQLGLQSLTDPAQNPVAALFTLGMIVVVLLLMILVLFLAVTLIVRSPEEAEVPQVRSTVSPVRSALSAVVITFLLGGAIVYGWTYSVSDWMCARCHFTQPAREAHAADVHASVKCAGCHVGTGLGNGIAARANGAQNLMSQLEGSVPPGPVSAPVANSACAACHANILEGTTLARGIRIRHSDLLEVGYSCIECHNTEGHGSAVRKPAFPKMSQCLTCHDSEQVSAECDVCHSEDVGVAVRRRQRVFPQVIVEREDCRGCHSIESCNECHGLELPHSSEFKAGYHARRGLLTPSTCIKCHDVLLFCNDCHRFSVTGVGAKGYARTHATPSSFVSWHSSAKPGGQGSCLCHDEDRQRFCNYCHGPQPER